MCQGIHKCTIPLDLKVPLTSIFQKLIDIFNLVLSSHLFHLSYELTLLIFFIHHHILVFTRRGHIQSYLIDFLSEFSLTRKKVLVSQSCPTLCDPVDVAHQAPLSVGFSKQEYWSGLPCLLQGIFLTQGSNSGLRHCRQILYYLSHQGARC